MIRTALTIILLCVANLVSASSLASLWGGDEKQHSGPEKFRVWTLNSKHKPMGNAPKFHTLQQSIIHAQFNCSMSGASTIEIVSVDNEKGEPIEVLDCKKVLADKKRNEPPYKSRVVIVPPETNDRYQTTERRVFESGRAGMEIDTVQKIARRECKNNLPHYPSSEVSVEIFHRVTGEIVETFQCRDL